MALLDEQPLGPFGQAGASGVVVFRWFLFGNCEHQRGGGVGGVKIQSAIGYRFWFWCENPLDTVNMFFLFLKIKRFASGLLAL